MFIGAWKRDFPPHLLGWSACLLYFPMDQQMEGQPYREVTLSMRWYSPFVPLESPRMPPVCDFVNIIYHLILTCERFSRCINAVKHYVIAIHADFKLHEFLVGTSGIQLQYIMLINVISLLIINFSHCYRKSNPCPTPAIIRSYINKFLHDFSSSNKKFRLVIDRIVQNNNLPKNNCIHPQHLEQLYP